MKLADWGGEVCPADYGDYYFFNESALSQCLEAKAASFSAHAYGNPPASGKLPSLEELEASHSYTVKSNQMLQRMPIPPGKRQACWLTYTRGRIFELWGTIVMSLWNFWDSLLQFERDEIFGLGGCALAEFVSEFDLPTYLAESTLGQYLCFCPGIPLVGVKLANLNLAKVGYQSNAAGFLKMINDDITSQLSKICCFLNNYGSAHMQGHYSHF
jgi:hypothetical protein